MHKTDHKRCLIWCFPIWCFPTRIARCFSQFCSSLPTTQIRSPHDQGDFSLCSTLVVHLQTLSGSSHATLSQSAETLTESSMEIQAVHRLLCTLIPLQGFIICRSPQRFELISKLTDFCCLHFIFTCYTRQRSVESSLSTHSLLTSLLSTSIWSGSCIIIALYDPGAMSEGLFL